MFREWITWALKIPKTNYVAYEKNGKKILVISTARRGGKIKRKIFSVEHLVDENLQFTDEMLAQEEELFQKLD